MEIALLAEWYPQTFACTPERRRPLKNKIFEDLCEPTEVLRWRDHFGTAQLSAALGRYTGHYAYWASCVAGTPRINLKGEEEGKVSPAEANYAYQRMQGLYWIPPTGE